MSGRITVTESELLRELRQQTGLDDAPPDAMTVPELARALRVDESTVRDRIKRYAREQRLATYRVSRLDVLGRPQRLNAYVLLPEAKPAKRKRA